jgi:beta-xylosidase
MFTRKTTTLIKNINADIRCSSSGSDNLWAGSIEYHINGKFHSYLLTTIAVFASSQDAISHVQALLEETRNS